MQAERVDKGEVIVRILSTPYVLRRIANDQRRTLYEADSPHGTLLYLQIHQSNLPLGVHYHRIKTETFDVVHGGGDVLLSRVNKNGERVGPIEAKSLRPGDTLSIPPYTAHTFYLDPGSTMICLSTHPFDPNDMLATPWLR